MRKRLIAVFLFPLLGVLLVLGFAYATSSARSTQQGFLAEQVADLGYFITSARHALISGDTSVLRGEVERFDELYGTKVIVLSKAGDPILEGPRDPVLDSSDSATQIQLALAGRRGELPNQRLPWSSEEALIVDPVFENRDVIGAVLIVSSTADVRFSILRQWAALTVISLLAVAAATFLIVRLADWVLRPVRRVDRAMAAMGSGHLEARIDDDTGPPELRRTIRAFNSMAEEIDRVLSQQRAFALNASHELRNPLNALLVRIEYLSTGLGPEWDADVEETREEGRRMARVLDTLLSLSRIVRGDSPLVEVDLAEVAANRAHAWQEVAAKEGRSISVSGQRHAMCMSDRTVVESALDAVIDNALKFSPAGGVVEITTTSKERTCSISVRDHGPGLLPEEIDHATERFWRSSRSQNVPGSGLGLAIASELLATVGGSIDVTSPEGGGLAVALHLPAGEAL